MLEIGNPSDAAKRLDDDEKHTLSNVEGIAAAQVQTFTIINESGLYSLTLTSRKPQAKAFMAATRLDEDERGISIVETPSGARTDRARGSSGGVTRHCDA